MKQSAGKVSSNPKVDKKLSTKKEKITKKIIKTKNKK